MRQRDRCRDGSFGGHHLHRDERGASLVEFALILPIFALLLFSMIDFGLIFQSFISMRNGVNAGARLAAVNGPMDSSCITQYPSPDYNDQMLCTVKDRIGTLLAVSSSSIAVEIDVFSPTSPSTLITSANSITAGDEVRVCAWGTMQSTTGLTAPFLNGKTMSATSV